MTRPHPSKLVPIDLRLAEIAARKQIQRDAHARALESGAKSADDVSCANSVFAAIEPARIRVRIRDAKPLR